MLPSNKTSMPKTRLIRTTLIAIAGVLHVHACSSAQLNGWESLSPDRAIETVRAFEGQPGLAVKVTGADAWATRFPDMYAESHLYKLASERYDYTVSKYSRYRFTRSDHLFVYNKPGFYGEAYHPSVLMQKVISQGAAEEVARSFMRSHFPAPALLKLTRSTPFHPSDIGPGDEDWIDSYGFVFTQDCGGGVIGPCFCTVSVDSVKAEVVSYTQFCYPVLVSTIPRLSGGEAMICAMNAVLSRPGEPGKVKRLYEIGRASCRERV